MPCLVRVDLETIKANDPPFLDNEWGTDEYIFHLNINGFKTRHPSSGHFSVTRDHFIFTINKNVYTQVVDDDLVSIAINLKVVEDDLFYDDRADAKLTLKLPCQNPLSLPVSFQAESFRVGSLEPFVYGEVFMRVRLDPIRIPPIP